MKKRIIVLIPLVALMALILAIPVGASTAILYDFEYPTSFLKPTLEYDVALVVDYGGDTAQYGTKEFSIARIPIGSGIDPTDVSILANEITPDGFYTISRYDRYANINSDYKVIGAPSNTVLAYFADTPVINMEGTRSNPRTYITASPTTVYRSDGVFMNTLGGCTIETGDNGIPTAYLTYDISYIYNNALQHVTGTMGAVYTFGQNGEVVYDFGLLVSKVIERSDSMVFNPTDPIRINRFDLEIQQDYDTIKFRSVHLNASNMDNNDNIVPRENVDNYSAVVTEPLNLTGFASAIMDAVDGVLSLEIMPNIDLYAVLAVVLGITGLVVVLKIFAGG